MFVNLYILRNTKWLIGAATFSEERIADIVRKYLHCNKVVYSINGVIITEV
jgi:hypothetical protein